jgi:thiol:disulfide interchange protein DsbC
MLRATSRRPNRPAVLRRRAPFHLAAAFAPLLIAAGSSVPAVGAPAGATTPVAPAAVAAPVPGAARPAAAPAAAGADVRAELARRIPGSRAEDFKTSPVPGIYELARGSDIVYVTADGKYAFAGDLFDIGSDTNVSERRRRDLRVQLMNGVPESQMVVFSPKDPKYTVTVFTDVDCGYCRKLHSEMAKYNELGIRVRYLFYPRSGPNTESWAKAEAVWCAADRNDALTRAKRGEAVKSPKCANTPVARPPSCCLTATCSVATCRPRCSSSGWSRAAADVPAAGAQRSSSLSLSVRPSHSLASAGGSPFSVMTGHVRDSSALS